MSRARSARSSDCRGAVGHPGRVRREAAAGALTVRLGITAALTDLDVRTGRAGADGGGARLRLALAARAHPPAGAGGRPRRPRRRRAPRRLQALPRSARRAVHCCRGHRARIRLGTGILLVAQHDPILLAKQVATLDHLVERARHPRCRLRVEPGRSRGPRCRLWPSARRRARAPRRHGGHLVDRRRPSTTASSSTSTRPGRGPNRCNSRGCVRWSAVAAATRCSRLSQEAPTDGSPSAVAAWPRPCPGCATRRKGRSRSGTSSRSCRSGPSPRRASSSISPGSAITEVVLRIHAGDSASVRDELESLAVLVPFAATLGAS